jgi:hypothetical protein
LPEGFLFGKNLHAVAQIKVFIRTNAEAALVDSVGVSRILSQPRLPCPRPQEILISRKNSCDQMFSHKMSKNKYKVIDIKFPIM